MKLKFVKLGINGEGIAYIDRKPVFCDGVYPHEEAEVEIIEDKKTYSRARLNKITWFSKERIRTDYPTMIEEGIPLFAMKYPSQLRYKKELLEEALYKYGNVRRDFVREIHGSEVTLGYRSQCKLPVQESHGHIMTGMYVPGTNHWHPIKESLIQDPQLEKARIAVLRCIDHSSLRAYDQNKNKGLRYLVMRAIDNKIQCTLVTGKDTIAEKLIHDIMEIDGMHSLFQSINTDRKTVQIFGSAVTKLAGEDQLTLTVNHIKLLLSPESFFQLNIPQAEKLYATAISKVDPCDTIVEAYCGVGAMSFMASSKAEHVYGIESVPSAIENAKKNAVLNGITNCEFYCMDAADGLAKVASRRQVDTLIVDPPRSGMDETMINTILKALPRKIIYISCNPATLAKNLKDLKHDYHVVTVIPFDLFPHTPHVESITVLERG